MINFPDSPTNGQVFTSGSTSWTWDTVKWNLNTTAATFNDSMPVGSIMWFAGSTAPPGWILANGAVYSNGTYPNLFAAIGNTYGGVVGTSFAVPSVASTTGAYYIRYTTAMGVTTTTSLTTAVVGTMMQWPITTSYPTGWLRCDGTSYSTTTYNDLFTLIGYTYGGSGSLFSVPNISGAGAGSPVYIIKATNSGLIEPSTVSHAASHVRLGSDIIDGDRLQIDFVPSYYTRNSGATGAGANTDLTAHLSGIDNLLNNKLSTNAYVSNLSGVVYGNMYAGTSGSAQKNIGTVTHNFGTGNYVINLTVWSANAFGDGFSANAQNRNNNSFDIIVSRIGASNWGDTGLYCSYFVWRW